MKCHKAQTVKRRNADGAHEYTKCVNMLAANFKNEVSPEICEKCPMRQTGPCKKNCYETRPRNAEFSEPVLEDGLLKYTEPGAPTPEGFVEVDGGFKSEWPDCPGLLTNNAVNPDGSLKIIAFCDFKKDNVDFETCKKCFSTLKLEKEVEAPALPTQIKHYAKAVYKWVAEGHETRTDEEVEAIFKDHCSQCTLYDKEKQICKHCGCRIKIGGIAVSNKLKMKSERCPLGKW